MMEVDEVLEEFEIFNNPLILGNILSHLGKEDLLSCRGVSKTFDDECVRIFWKRGCAKWVNTKEYFENVEELLKDSRHPQFLIGKIKLEGLDVDLDCHSEFIEMVNSYAYHVKRLWFQYYPFEEVLSILNACSNIVELKLLRPYLMDNDDPNLISKIAFKLKNLYKLELNINGDGSEWRIKFGVDVFKKIVTSSDLTLLSIKTWRLAPFLKAIVDDSVVSKKMESVKALIVDNADISDIPLDDPILEDNNTELLKLLDLLRVSLENLYLCGSSWKGLETKYWPTMSNLKTLTFGEEEDDSLSLLPNFLPRRMNAPKLNLLLVGNHESVCQQAWKNNGKWEMGLDDGMKGFQDRGLNKDEKGGAFPVALWAKSINLIWIEHVINLLRGMEVEQLFLNVVNGRDRDYNFNGHFLLKCIHHVPSLTQFWVCTTDVNDENVQFRRISLK